MRCPLQWWWHPPQKLKSLDELSHAHWTPVSYVATWNPDAWLIATQKRGSIGLFDLFFQPNWKRSCRPSCPHKTWRQGLFSWYKQRSKLPSPVQERTYSLEGIPSRQRVQRSPSLVLWLAKRTGSQKTFRQQRLCKTRRKHVFWCIHSIEYNARGETRRPIKLETLLAPAPSWW